MHIAFIEDTELHGGTQLWVMDAIDFFLRQGWEITVITPENGFVAKESSKNNLNINLVTYDFSGIIAQTNKYVIIWGRALEASDIAVCTVHPPRNNFQCSMFAARCIKELELKVRLITKTGTIVPSYSRQYYLPDELTNSRVVTITQTIQQYLISEYKIPEEKILLLHQGIDLKYFRSNEGNYRSPLKNKLISAKPILGCIGSLEQRKGQIYLLKAVDIIRREEFPDIHLLIVGDGPDEKMLKEQLNTLNLHSNVSIIPFTRSTREIFQVCDMLILPSISKEGLPNVILEGFAMHIPTVASDIGGISEVVKNGYSGYLVKPRDTEMLAEAIVTLWKDQENYSKMAMHARHLVVQHHNRESQMYKFDQYFKSLL
ncbi:MAG: glycosyltransferase family 4 protein [Candidatus Hodarchaeales archaeon]|jgi:glycosyltransferase involved in cell wall biosynthesis